MNDASILIRPATTADAEAISGLVIALSEQFITPDFPPAGADHLLSQMVPQAVHSYLAGSFRFHVAEKQRRVIGVVAIRDNKHLYYLFVDEEFHQQGIGRQLWQVAQAAALRAGNVGEFTVNASRLSVPVYQRFGFTATAAPETKHGVTYFPMKLTLAPETDQPPSA